MQTPDRQLSISQLIAILEQVGPDSPLFPAASKLLDGHLLPPGSAHPAATPRGPERLLTLGMATYDDYDGVYFTVQAIRLYHPEVTAQTEILVIDNHPEGACAEPLRRLALQVAGCRYVPYASHRGTAVRDLLFREACGQFVLSMDSHVQFAPGALARLVRFFEERPESNDLWQGPLVSDDLKGLSSHFSPVWSGGMFGQWASDVRAADPDGPPFEIPMQGLGVFACRREAWPGFNPRFSGFGGEEGYIHDKFRGNGGRTFCLPFLRWTHRFNRPFGAPYRPLWRERIRNYLIACEELGQDPAPIQEHFSNLLGAEAKGLIETAEREIRGPLQRFDAVYSIRRGDTAEAWRAVDLECKVRFLPAPETPYCDEIGRTLALRRVIEEAERQHLDRVLVFDSDFVPSSEAMESVRGAMEGLRGEPAFRSLMPGVFAFDARGTGSLLSALPESASAMALWIRQGHSLRSLEANL